MAKYEDLSVGQLRVTGPSGATAAAATPVTGIVIYSQSLTPVAVATIVAAEQNFTVTGLTTADKVIVNPFPTGNATALCSARVSAANTLTLSYVNPTAGSLTPAAGAYTIIAIRS